MNSREAPSKAKANAQKLQENTRNCEIAGNCKPPALPGTKAAASGLRRVACAVAIFPQFSCISRNSLNLSQLDCKVHDHQKEKSPPRPTYLVAPRTAAHMAPIQKVPLHSKHKLREAVLPLPPRPPPAP